VTIWKVALKLVDGSFHRAVVDAGTMDLAIAGAKLGCPQPRNRTYGAGAQAMNDRELANRDAAEAHFIANGFFPLFDG